MDVSFVIPCYGSEHTIEKVVDELRTTMAQRPECSYEIVLVNDNSPDQVWGVIQKLVKTYSNMKGISLARNFGQHAALMAGYRSCSGDIVVSLDDDGQTPADEAFLLIDKIKEGYDVVYGCYPEIKQSHFRIFGSWVNEKMIEVLLGKPRELKCTSYYAARRFIIEEMLRYRNSYPYVGGLVLRSTKNIANVPVHHRARMEGKSGYSLGKLLALWFNGFTAFSVKPLRLATVVGFLCAAAGFIYGVVMVLRRLLGYTTVLGYSSLITVILFIGGIIMVLLGIIGEYIGRIYISINNAPQYVIRETIGGSDEKTD